MKPITEKSRKKFKCLIFRFRLNILTDMFINIINGVINKILSIFFFPPGIKLAWKAKQKQREMTKNQLFFLLFFLKIQDIRKLKTPIFERG